MVAAIWLSSDGTVMPASSHFGWVMRRRVICAPPQSGFSHPRRMTSEPSSACRCIFAVAYRARRVQSPRAYSARAAACRSTCSLIELRAAGSVRARSTVAEIERAIEKLPPAQMLEVATRFDERHQRVTAWPVPPPNVPREELKRMEAEIEAAFPTKRS